MYVATSTKGLNLTSPVLRSCLHPLVVKAFKIFGASAYVSLGCGAGKLEAWREWWSVEAGGVCCEDWKLGLET